MVTLRSSIVLWHMRTTLRDSADSISSLMQQQHLALMRQALEESRMHRLMEGTSMPSLSTVLFGPGKLQSLLDLQWQMMQGRPL
jgi:hypothetical protein